MLVCYHILYLFITLPSFSWGLGWLSRDLSLSGETRSDRQKMASLGFWSVAS